MIALDPATPLRSMRLLAPAQTHRALGARRDPPVSEAAVAKAERGGASIQLDTLAAYAEALGYELVICVRAKTK